MSNSYSTVPLGDVIRQRSEFIEIDDFKAYKRCRVQLHAHGIVLRDVIQGTDIKTKKQQVCHAGEFLVAEIDAKVGGFGVVPNDLDGAVVSSHYFLFDLDEDVLNRRFLEYFVLTPAFMEQVKAQGTTNYAAIRPGDVLGYKIPLPSLEEQRRIVARIEELAARIEEARGLRREAVEEVEIMHRHIYELIWLEANKSSLSLNLLEQIADVVDPQPDHRTPAEIIGGMPYVSIANISIDGKVDVLGARKVSPTAIERQESSFTIKTGDIVLGKIGTIGAARPIIVDQRFALSANVVLVQPERTKILDKFLLTLLRSPQIEEQIIGGIRLTAQGAFGIKKMRKLVIPLPPLSEQNRIVNHLDHLQSKVDALKSLQSVTSAELDALLPSILDKAFKGDL